VDISGNPWIEIDFPEDELRARSEILPRIEILEKH
jgi:choline kinase